MTIKGYNSDELGRSNKKLDGFTDEESKIKQHYATLSPLGNKQGLDTVVKVYYPLALAAAIDAAQPTVDADRVLNITGHGAKVGDVLKIVSDPSGLTGTEAAIIGVPNANQVILGSKLPFTPTASVTTVEVLRGLSVRSDANGALQTTQGPVIYLLDGANQQVTEDTAVPANNRFLPTMASFVRDGVETKVNRDTAVDANNRPFPVELISTSGTPATFNLTTGDIGIHVAHDGNAGAAYDSVRIGDGSNIAGVNASLELLVKDTDVATALATLNGTDFATQTTLAALLAAFSAEDFASQTTLAALLAAFSAEDFASETTLAALRTDFNAEDFATQTTLAALLAAFSAEDFATQTTLAALLAAFSAEDFASQTTLASIDTKVATETTLAAINGKLPVSLGQKTQAASFSVTPDLTTQAILVAIRDRLPSSLGETTESDSLPVVLASDVDVRVADQGKTPVDFVRNDYTVTAVTTAAITVLDGSLAQACTSIEIFDSSGETLELTVDGTPVLRIFPGGNGLIPVKIAAAAAVGIRAVSNNATVGEVNINFYQ